MARRLRTTLRDGQSLHFLAGSVVSAAAVVVLGVLVARTFGATGRGVVSLALAAVLLGGVTSTLGLELSLSRATARAGHAPAPWRWMVWLVGGVGAALGSVLGVVFLVLSDARVEPSVLIATAFATSTTAVSTISTGVLVGRGDALAVSTSRSAGGAVTVAVGAAWLVAGGPEASAVAALGVGLGVTALLQVRAISRRSRAAGQARTRELLLGAARVHAGSVLQALTYRLDLVLVGALLGAADLGVYSVAVSVAVLLWFVPDALGASLLRRTAMADTDPEAALEKATRSVVLVGVGTGAVLAAIGSFVIPLVFGRDFDDAYVPLLILLPGVVALGVWKVHANYLYARGRDLSKVRGGGVGAVVTVVLDLALIPPLGIDGAALGASLAYLSVTAEGCWEMRRLRPRPSVPALFGLSRRAHRGSRPVAR